MRKKVRTRSSPAVSRPLDPPKEAHVHAIAVLQPPLSPRPVSFFHCHSPCSCSDSRSCSSSNFFLPPSAFLWRRLELCQRRRQSVSRDKARICQRKSSRESIPQNTRPGHFVLAHAEGCSGQSLWQFQWPTHPQLTTLSPTTRISINDDAILLSSSCLFTPYPAALSMRIEVENRNDRI